MTQTKQIAESLNAMGLIQHKGVIVMTSDKTKSVTFQLVGTIGCYGKGHYLNTGAGEVFFDKAEVKEIIWLNGSPLIKLK